MSVIANVAINLDSSQATRALNALGGEAQKAATGIGGAFQNLGSKIEGFGQKFQNIGSVLAGIGAGAALKGIIEAGIKSEELTKRIKTLAGSTEEADKIFKIASEGAKMFGLSQQAAGEQVADLYGRLGPMGVSLDDIQSIFFGVNKAANAMGLSMHDVDAVMLQLSQALGSGVLQGDEFRSIMERMPAVGQAVAKVLGVNVGELKKMSSEGKITTDVMILAAKELEKMALVDPSPMKQFQAAIADLNTELGKQLMPLLNPIIQGLTAVLRVFGALPDPLKQIIAGVIALAGGFVILAPLIAPIGTAISLLGTVITAFTTFLAGGSGLAGAITAIIAIITGPVGWIAAFIALAAIIWSFRDQIGAFFAWLGEALMNAVKAFWDIGEPIRQFWVGLWKSILEIVQSYITILGQFWGKIAELFINNVVKPIQDAWGRLIEFLGQAAQRAGEYIGRAWGVIVRFFESNVVKPIERLWNNLISFLGKAADQAGNLINKAWNGISKFFINSVVKPIQQGWEGLVTSIVRNFKVIYDGLVSAWGNITNFFDNNVAKPISNALEQVVKLAENIMPNIGRAIRSAFDGTVNFVKGVVNGLIGAFEGLANAAVRTLNKLIEGANKLPNVNIGYISEIKLPRLAEGGFATLDGIQGYAKGGLVERGTLAIVGEAGPEYIIPEGKMLQASLNYLNGKRGASVIPQMAEGGFAGSPQINVQTGPVMQQNGQNYVTMEDLQRAMRETADGVLRSLRTPSARYGLGIS
jgi:tape measure domain-containing protein